MIWIKIADSHISISSLGKAGRGRRLQQKILAATRIWRVLQHGRFRRRGLLPWQKPRKDDRMTMKVLFLVQKEQRVILDRLYESVIENTDCDLLWLSDKEQADLRSYFRQHINVAKYDRIIIFLRFKKEIRQIGFLQTIPNLVILEHDAWQNYFPCKYQG